MHQWTINWQVEHTMNGEGNEGRVKSGVAGAKWRARA